MTCQDALLAGTLVSRCSQNLALLPADVHDPARILLARNLTHALRRVTSPQIPFQNINIWV
jgi:hypothetical protein